MFQGFFPETVDFMWGIRFNNEKTWFEAHKQDYLNYLYSPMKALCAQVYEGLGQECAKRGMISKVARIYRDARRVHHEGPYKDHLWFSIEQPSEAFAAHPCFWFELTPESWSMGLGYYAMRPVTMAKFRARMEGNPRRYQNFWRKFSAGDRFVLEGPDYKKTRPAPTESLSQWYNKKSFSFSHEEPLTQVIYSPSLSDTIIEAFQFLMPFFDELSTLDGDPEPAEWSS